MIVWIMDWPFWSFKAIRLSKMGLVPVSPAFALRNLSFRSQTFAPETSGAGVEISPCDGCVPGMHIRSRVSCLPSWLTLASRFVPYFLTQGNKL